MAVEEGGPLLEESDDCLIGQALACLDLVHDGPDVGVFVLFGEVLNNILDADDPEAVLIFDVLCEGALAALGLANDEDYRHEVDIPGHSLILLQSLRIPYHVLPLLFVPEVVYPISVNKRIRLGVFHQGVRIELAEPAIRNYVIIEEVVDSEPVDC